jgi:hypothetical protein
MLRPFVTSLALLSLAACTRRVPLDDSRVPDLLGDGAPIVHTAPAGDFRPCTRFDVWGEKTVASTSLFVWSYDVEGHLMLLVEEQHGFVKAVTRYHHQPDGLLIVERTTGEAPRSSTTFSVRQVTATGGFETHEGHTLLWATDEHWRVSSRWAFTGPLALHEVFHRDEAGRLVSLERTSVDGAPTTTGAPLRFDHAGGLLDDSPAPGTPTFDTQGRLQRTGDGTRDQLFAYDCHQDGVQTWQVPSDGPSAQRWTTRGLVKQTLREGDWETFDAQGRLVRRQHFVAGLRDGPSVELYENGQPRQTCTWARGQLASPCAVFTPP